MVDQKIVKTILCVAAKEAGEAEAYTDVLPIIGGLIDGSGKVETVSGVMALACEADKIMGKIIPVYVEDNLDELIECFGVLSKAVKSVCGWTSGILFINLCYVMAEKSQAEKLITVMERGRDAADAVMTYQESLLVLADAKDAAIKEANRKGGLQRTEKEQENYDLHKECFLLWMDDPTRYTGVNAYKQDMHQKTSVAISTIDKQIKEFISETGWTPPKAKRGRKPK